MANKALQQTNLSVALPRLLWRSLLNADTLGIRLGVPRGIVGR